MKPTRILLTRHGQTVTNRDGLFCGHSETDLTELGLRQACALARRLRNVPIHAAYTSDFSRTIETARVVLDGRGIAPQVDPSLREIHYGEWELRKERSVARTRKWREEFARMRAEDPAWRPPGGETIHEVRERTLAALQRIAARHRGQTTLVVTHGTAINCMLAGVLGMVPDFTFRIQVDNCSLSELVRGGNGFVVATLNDTSHLADVEPGS